MNYIEKVDIEEKIIQWILLNIQWNKRNKKTWK